MRIALLTFTVLATLGIAAGNTLPPQDRPSSSQTTALAHSGGTAG